jgi:hypothetical protein
MAFASGWVYGAESRSAASTLPTGNEAGVRFASSPPSHMGDMLMIKNLGGADRAVRLVVGATLGFLVGMTLVEGWLAIALAVIAAYLLVTALTGACPLYSQMEIDTFNHDDAYVRLDERI